MAPKETLQSIRNWANTAFPDNFAKFDQFIKSSRFTFSQFRPQLGNDESPFKVDGVQVGTAHGNSAPIFAWKGTESIDLGHEVGKSRVKPHDDFTDSRIEFAVPFCWVDPTENEVGLARFEALVRYLILAHKRAAAMRHGIALFKEHFPGACRDIVEQFDRRDNKTPTLTPSLTPTAQTPAQTSAETPVQTPTRTSRAPQTPRILRSLSQVVPQRPATPASPALANDLLLRNVDQAISSYRASVLAQIGAAQATSRRETTELQTKIRGLELELVNTASDQNDLRTETASLNNKIEELKTQLRDIEKEKNDIETESASVKTKMSELEAKLVDVEEARTHIETDFDARGIDICELKERLQGVEKSKAYLETRFVSLDTKKDELDAKLLEAENDRKGLRKELGNLAEKVTEAEKKAETWKVRYEELKKDVLGAVMKPE